MFSEAADNHPSLNVASMSGPCWPNFYCPSLAGLVLGFPLSSFLFMTSPCASSRWSLWLLRPSSFVVVLSESIFWAMLSLCPPGKFQVVGRLVNRCLKNVSLVLFS